MPRLSGRLASRPGSGWWPWPLWWCWRWPRSASGFYTRSPLWLDEALTVNISRLPLGQIPGALRHDGHPPLFYVLLHGWMLVFGQGNLAVRSLSGLFGLALFPLVWIAGKRLAGRRGAVSATVVLALSPYAIRYSTETRMYSLVMVLALAAWLVADDALENPTALRLVGLALLAAALLWSHYWAMWFLGAAGLGLLVHLWRMRRAGRRDEARHTVLVLGALAVGGLLFIPWLPSLLYQSAHTGTPWASPIRPTEMVAQSIDDLGGGPQGEGVLLGVFLVVLMVIALFGRAIDRRRIELDLATRPEGRPMLIVIAGTMAIASVVGYATHSAFATRYIAVIVPFVILLTRRAGAVPLRRHLVAFRLVAVTVLLLGAAGGVPQRDHRPDRGRGGGGRVPGPGPLGRPGDHLSRPVGAGPGPRALPHDVRVVTYPDFALGPVRRLGRLHAATGQGQPREVRHRGVAPGRHPHHLVRLGRHLQDPPGHLRSGAAHDARSPAVGHQPHARRRLEVLRARRALAPAGQERRLTNMPAVRRGAVAAVGAGRLSYGSASGEARGRRRSGG